MNYLELLNAFYVTIQCSRVSNNGQLLYHTLLMINNKSSWSDWFPRTNVSIYSLMNISEKAFINARSELKRLGLIDFVTSRKRGECTKYRILCPMNYSTGEGTKEVQTQAQSADLYKQKTKTKNYLPLTPSLSDKRQNGGGLPRSRNQFHNFEQRKVDYDALMLEKVQEMLSQSTASCEEG